jgi:hypothetical protein
MYFSTLVFHNSYLKITSIGRDMLKENVSEPFFYFNVFFNFKTCTVHILLFCAMTSKCTIISQIITLLHVLTLSCHPQGACAKLRKYFNGSCW